VNRGPPQAAGDSHQKSQRAILPVPPPIREPKKRSSTPAIIALSIAIFFLFTVILAQATLS